MEGPLRVIDRRRDGNRLTTDRERRADARRYRDILDAQSDLICRLLPDATLTYVNEACCRFWGSTREELLGRNFVELMPPGAREPVQECVQALLAGLDSSEHQVLVPDGTAGWQQWTLRAIVDDRGRVTEFQGVGCDVTERKRAEEALRQAEARNTALIRAIPDLMFVVKRDGTYVDYHARDPRLLFAPPDAFLGKTVREVLPRPLSEVLMDAIDRAFQSDETIVVEYQLALGKTRYFEARIVRAGQDSVVTTVRDMTDLRRTMQANRDLAGRLIASQEVERHRIARELHDDVSQRIAVVKITLDQIASQPAARAFESRLRELSNSVGSIAKDLYTVSHALHPSKLRTLGLTAAIDALCREISEQQSVQVTFAHHILAPVVPPNVSLCLFRIAQEGLHNIARHSRAREARVQLMEDSGHLTLQIADSGVGFDPQDIQHAGLGLLSMRERVAFLGGQLAIHARPGGGTRIGVRVPVRDPESPSAASALPGAVTA